MSKLRLDAFPPGWVEKLFDTYDANPDKNMRIVRLDTAAMCSHKNLARLGDDIVTQHSTKQFSIMMFSIASISIIALLVMFFIIGISLSTYVIFVAYMAALGKYYLERCRHVFEKQKYAGSVLVEVCNIVLIENESDINDTLQSRITELQNVNNRLRHTRVD